MTATRIVKLSLPVLFLFVSSIPAFATALPDGPRTSIPSPDALKESATSIYPEEAPGTQPLLIVPGWGSRPDDVYYWSTFSSLRRAGYKTDQVHSVAFGDYSYQAVGSPEDNAETLARKVRTIYNEADQKVDLIAHSMGGLAARWFVERMDGDRYVDDLITMGTPHQGNNVSYLFYFTEGAQAMVPGSNFLDRLDTDTLSDDVDYLNLWSMTDFFYVNRWNARLPPRVVKQNDNVTQLRYSFTPHLLMPYMTVDEYLSHLD